jgi:tRNA(adenine34) deaminase
MCSYVLRHHKIETIIYGTDVDYVGGLTSQLKVMLTTSIPSWGKAPIIIGNLLKEEFDKLSEEYNSLKEQN